MTISKKHFFKDSMAQVDTEMKTNDTIPTLRDIGIYGYTCRIQSFRFLFQRSRT